MTTDALTLGSITFADFEIPSKINFGGSQRLVVHTLGDGTRIIDALGPDDSDIGFRGFLSGPNAVARAQLLDAMRISGDVVSLSWASLLFPVVIRSISVEFINPFWVGFEIVCTKITATGPRIQLASDALAMDIDAALQTISSLGAIPDVASSDAAQALTQANVTNIGSDAYSSAITLTAAVTTSLQQQLQYADIGSMRISATTSIDASNARELVVAAQSSSYNLWQISTASGYWGQIEKGLLNANT